MNSNSGGDWTDSEINRFINRQNRLQKIGMTEMDAEKLAERLVYRDRDETDDRRLCLECKNWRGKCMKPNGGYCTIPTMLQRCDGFMAVQAVKTLPLEASK